MCAKKPLSAGTYVIGSVFLSAILLAISFCPAFAAEPAQGQLAKDPSTDKPPHQELSCGECHEQTLNDKFQALRKELGLQLEPGHDRVHEKIQLSESDVLLLHERCQDCHSNEFDQWQRSGHSVKYAQVFLDRRHNKLQQLNDDCLRCHGLFFDGTIHDLVTPVNSRGPWRPVDPKQIDKPAIPCLSCHQIHARQHTAISQDSTTPELITENTGTSPAGFFDRREKYFFTADQLPVPRISHGDDQLEIASDKRMRVCYQCHAPTVTHHANSGDDRTLRGVHAKLSCFDCHQDHSLRTDNSCADCHPAQSNCGLDVRRMDTTYNAKASANDIHTVRCQDCHADGAPGDSGADRENAF